MEKKVTFEADNLIDVNVTIKRCVRALKNLQVNFTTVEADFFKEAHLLQATKYQKMYEELTNRRAAIIIGDHKPSDEESHWALEEFQHEPFEGRLTSVVEGIPDFWLTIFRNVDQLSEMMGPDDEPILRCLTDIAFVYQAEPIGFDLVFSFKENEFFEDNVLVKKYLMSGDPDAHDPFLYDGLRINKCVGCTIHWKAGKNVTVKTSRGNGMKYNQSFFNFFNPPLVSDDPSVMLHPVVNDLLVDDYVLAERMRDYIIPRAVLYYTGEGLIYDIDQGSITDSDSEDEETETESEADENDE